jgi:hypothetical protein
MTKSSIGQAFSLGKFKEALPYVSSTVVWSIVGDSLIEGKEQVEAYCEQVGNYFASVETNFKVLDIIESLKRIVITGSAVFMRDGAAINNVQSCDVYEFNASDEIQRITSYCIQLKN